jgi:hypothetical protein
MMPWLCCVYLCEKQLLLVRSKQYKCTDYQITCQAVLKMPFAEYEHELLQNIQRHFNGITVRKRLRSIYQRSQEVHRELIA